MVRGTSRSDSSKPLPEFCGHSRVSCRRNHTILSGHLHQNPFEGITDFDATCDVLHDVAEANGIPYFSYLHLKGRAQTDRFIANYPQEWRERYERKLYIHYDPVVAVGRESRLPYFWDNSSFISPFRKSEQKVFHEAGAYGINAGYSIPIAGKIGELGLFSIAAPNDPTLLKALNGATHLIYVLGIQLHDHVLSLGADEQETVPEIALSARELECLKWAAEGLTTEQIGDRMAISAATVNYHFNKIVPKFEAANRHHAAIKAVRLGLI